MNDKIELLRRRNIIEILLELRKINGPIDKNTLNFRIVGDRQPRQSIYDGCNELEKAKLIDVDKESKPNKHFVTLTEEGKEIARKLSYVFDDKKEVIVLPKTKYDILKKMLEYLGEGTVDEFVLGSILEKIESHKGLKRGGRQRID